LTEQDAETHATALLATCGVGVVVTVCRDGQRWVEYRWREPRRMSRRKCDKKGV
jgi:hypothetical protein